MKKTTLKNLFLFTVAGLFASCQPSEKVWELNSPENNLRITVAETENPEYSGLIYKVDRMKDGQAIAVIENSPLGIDRKDQQFSSGLKFVSKGEVKTIDETYNMLIGRQTECRNHARELELTFKNQQGSLIQLVMRAYNDGVAFRYVFPEKSDSTFTIVRELTGFKVPETGKAWIQRYDVPSKWTPAYEKFYEDGMSIGTASPNAEGWAFPALFNSNNNWVLITEANLTPNYCGIRMDQNAPNGLYRVRFPETKDAEGFGAVEPVSSTPWVMPWRVIAVGETLATIFETNLINNLADPAIAGDFSWVKPGRASWSWISENDSPKKFQALKNFVDLAAEMNWEYSLVDANWDLMTGGNIEQLVQYANSKGVGILMWYNSGGPQNVVTERPRDIMFDPQLRKAEFKKLKEWGVKGVKIDFWHSDKQNLIALYHDVMKDAADNQILVNFHGCTIPRGWSRTYPNLIGLESVKGEECYLFDEPYTEAAPIQNTILPFTRNVIGPMDYTPVGFCDLKYPHITTNAHELALSLVFNVGILHFADNVKTYRAQPDFIKEFLKTVPVVFDETHLISGEPGKSILMASRKGNNWYIAGINGEKSVKEISVELPFISSGEFELSLISDGENSRTFAYELKTFKARESIQVKMLETGGFVAVLKAK
ncbi:MAG TPA: alpha-glucosidase [Prolixibacteraceae bacterium]|nr:alpha-glucosidase [Prolixibacteraceae bacterium]